MKYLINTLDNVIFDVKLKIMETNIPDFKEQYLKDLKDLEEIKKILEKLK